jgi:drug/metabolite transporter (DMT)-like permease
MLATTVSTLVGALLLGRLAVPAGADQWGIVLGIAAIGTALPIFLYVSGLDRIPASHASVLSTAEPVVTVSLGVVTLGESITPVLVMGGLLVLVGVVLVQLDVTRETETPG